MQDFYTADFLSSGTLSKFQHEVQVHFSEWKLVLYANNQEVIGRQVRSLDHRQGGTQVIKLKYRIFFRHPSTPRTSYSGPVKARGPGCAMRHRTLRFQVELCLDALSCLLRLGYFGPISNQAKDHLVVSAAVELFRARIYICSGSTISANVNPREDQSLFLTEGLILGQFGEPGTVGTGTHSRYLRCPRGLHDEGEPYDSVGPEDPSAGGYDGWAHEICGEPRESPIISYNVEVQPNCKFNYAPFNRRCRQCWAQNETGKACNRRSPALA
ncbi:hypothetical protein B0H19DRAFT_1068168 [Mycena capillaripes]|nr:hypothetical protein B0H19DRAFT_1068168 [Mycena capillaripes]